MTNNDNIRDEKLQYEVNREAAKIFALSSGKIDKMNILKVNKYYLLSQIMEQVKFTHSLLGQVLEKQIEKF